MPSSIPNNLPPQHTESVPPSAQILSQCLQAIERKEATVDSCVRQYPGYRELGDLLRMAATAHELPSVKLSQTGKDAIRERMLSQYRQQAHSKKPVVIPRQKVGWLRPLAALLMIIVLLFGGGTGFIGAARAAVPGDALYGVKRSAERIVLSLSSGEARIGVLESIAQERLHEINVLVSRGGNLSEAILDAASNDINAALNAQPDPARRSALMAQVSSVLQNATNAGVISNTTQEKVFAHIDTSATAGQGTGTPADVSTAHGAATTIPAADVTVTAAAAETGPMTSAASGAGNHPPVPTARPPIVQPIHHPTNVPPTPRGNGNPGGNNGNPGSNNGNPGNNNGNSGNNNGNSGNNNGNSGNNNGNPGGNQGNPGSNNGNPGGNQGHPSGNSDS